MSLPIALQLYSVRNELSSDFENSIRKIKDFGYDGVEFAGLHNQKPSYIKSLLEQVGLNPISAHVSLEQMLEDPDKVFETYSYLGCKYIALPYLPEQRRPNHSMFNETLNDIELLGRKAKQAGLQLLYHNHDFEFVRIGKKFGLDVIYETISEDILKTQLDTCWIKVAGQDPVEYIRKYSGRAPIVHLKDFYKKETMRQVKMYDLIGLASDQENVSDLDTFGFMPLGFGVQDIPSILYASVDAGAQWVVVEQDMPQKGRTALECARLSIKYVNNLIW